MEKGQSNIKKNNIPSGYIKRKSSTIPFGYEVDDRFSSFLKPIPADLRALKEITEAFFNKEISLAKGVKILKSKTGKKMSTPGFLKHVNKVYNLKKTPNPRKRKTYTDYQTEERKNLVFKYRIEGMSLNDIASLLGVSKSTINKDIREMKEEGIAVPNSKFTDSQTEERKNLVFKYRTEGMSLNDIASLLGVGKSTIERDIREMKEEGIAVPNSKSNKKNPLMQEKLKFRKEFIQEKIEEDWTIDQIAIGLGISSGYVYQINRMNENEK